MNKEKRGFTLIELLIVIGILAVLATATVLVLNPAQLFAQARDSQRISDLSAVEGAINLYLSTVSSPDLETGFFTCGTNWGASSTIAPATKWVAATSATASNLGVRTIAGAGWVPVNFTSIPGGSPLATLPVDPVNNAAYNYQYTCNTANVVFELNADLESQRYRNTGPDDKESRDGGNNANIYEVGTDPDLDI